MVMMTLITLPLCSLFHRIWILEPKKRPAPITKELQFFLQFMLGQYSLLFQNRGGDAPIDRHASLCANVLNIFLSIARTMGSALSAETWEVFMKLFLGIDLGVV